MGLGEGVDALSGVASAGLFNRGNFSNSFCLNFSLFMLLGGSGLSFSSSKTSLNNLIAFISSVGPSLGSCVRALSNYLAASSILSAEVSVGIAMAWCFIFTVSDIRSLPVDGKIPLNAL